MAGVALADPGRFGVRALPGQDELPSSDGEPMETGFHDAQGALLKDTLIDAWDARRDFFVGGNMFVYFSERQIRANDFRGPDVFVVLDCERKGRKSWVAWEEGGKLPDVVIEVTSESTAHVDRGEKMAIYSRIWRTPAYFIFDPNTRILEGYRLDGASRNYVPIAPDARGDLPVAPLGLSLGLRPTRYRDYEEPFVRWLDEHGTPLPAAGERAEQEHARAEQEHARAEQERARAEQERARAEEALARLSELEGRLRGSDK
jgi:Uma2 family endonuclease